MLLLSALCLSYLKSISTVTNLDPFDSNVFGSWLWSNNLRREETDEVSNHFSNNTVPEPDQWRYEEEEEQPIEEEEKERVLWPNSLSLHLLSSSWTAVVSIHMWFYILHLKLFGHRFKSWSICCVKQLSPSITWDDIKWPLLILPHCKFKDAIKLVSYMPSYLWPLLTRDTYYHPKPQLPAKKEPKSKPKPPNLLLKALALLATVQAASGESMQLKSDIKLRQSLQRFKNPAGGLYTDRLSNSTSQKEVHKALVSKIHSDTKEFQESIGEEHPIISTVLDTGASFTAVPDKTLIVPNSLHKLSTPIELDGIAGGCSVNHCCVIEFECVDKHGDTFQKQTAAYYHPELPCTLLSPQSLLRDEHNSKIHSSEQALSKEEQYFKVLRNKVEWHEDGKHLMDILYDSSFIPRLQMFKVGTAGPVLKGFHASVTGPSNRNLSPLKKVWLRLHHILGHPSFSLVQQLAAGGWFDAKAMGLSQLPPSQAPMCEACKYGKQVRIPDGNTVTSKVQAKEGALKVGFTEPGQRIFSDQLVSFQTGRLFHTAGRESEDKQFCGSTVFVDAASGYIHVEHQVTLNASDTINAKHQLERMAMELGVTVDSYHTDNGVYKSKAFTEELATNYQQISFSGVGAKWQNGVAEGAIRIVVSRARTMMIHAHIHWPEVKDDSLWPMALSHAAYLYNNTPNERSGIAPVQIFSKTVSDGQVLRNLHTWGCPAYVLEPKLTEAGGKIPKWKPRSRRAQYMGVSPVHAETVALVKNLRTGYISPQFHVVFDDDFETVYAEEDEPPPSWEDMCIFQRFQVEFEEGMPVPTLADEWLSPDEVSEQQVRRKLGELRGRRKLYQDLQSKGVKEDLHYKPPPPLPIIMPDHRKPPDKSQQREVPATRELSKWVRSGTSTPAPSTPTPAPVQSPTPSPVKSLPPTPRRNPTRHAPRQPLNVQSFSGPTYDNHSSSLQSASKSSSRYASAFVAALSLYNPTATNLFHHQLLGYDSSSGTQEYIHPATLQSPFYLANPMALKAKKTKDPDLPSTREALAGPNADKFWEAMDKEIESLESKGTWTLVDRSFVPKGVKVIPGTWQQRIKRHPDGSLSKYKSRWCFRGDLERNTYEGNPYSPLVGWPTIRAAMLLAATQNWKSRQVDFTLAFCQSPQERPVYMELPQYYKPKGCEGRDVVLKLNKSIYGQMDSPKLFYQHLCKGMTKLGFVAADSDPCLFIHKKEKIMVLNYCDDQIWLCPDNAKIEEYVTKLKGLGYDLTLEDKGDNVFGFLGIEIQNKDGTIEWTQKGLINKVINYLGMSNASGKDTPAAVEPLGTDKDGDPFKEEWSYPAAIGMLLYLSSNTRPDLQFAVHQAARFTHNPKHSHAQAVKRIVRYLIQTRERGTIFKPDLSQGLDCYVDADFAGLYGYEDEQDPVSVRSRTGFVLTLFGCPIVWSSKLQTETTLSSTAAEYVAFSMAMRELLPMRAMLKEIGNKLEIDVVKTSLVRSTVFEDNQGCLSLVNVPKMSPRNKYLALKYHFFRSEIGEEKGVVAKYINTKEQIADCFTKGLPGAQFQVIRQLLIGW